MLTLINATIRGLVSLGLLAVAAVECAVAVFEVVATGDAMRSSCIFVVSMCTTVAAIHFFPIGINIKMSRTK